MAVSNTAARERVRVQIPPPALTAVQRGAATTSGVAETPRCELERAIRWSDRCRQRSVARQVTVDGRRCRAAFRDGPDDEGLTATHVARGVDAGHVRRERAVTGDVAPRVDLDAKVLDEPDTVGAGEAHGEQHELTRDLDVGALDLRERGPSLDDLAHDLVQHERADAAVV